MEENFNKQTKEMIDTTDATNPTTTVRIDHIHTDLGSQAACINQNIQKAKEGICQVVEDIFNFMDEDAVNIAIESMYDFTARYLSLEGQDMEEDCDFTWKGLSDLESGIYYRKELAKNLFSLYLKK